MPGWVGSAVSDYSARMPGEFSLEWREIKAEPRGSSGSRAVWLQREAERIGAAIPPSAWRVILDERGRDVSTQELARRLSHWREQSKPVALLIGGPDGLAPELRQSANETLRLSSLTLAHPLVRVLLAEQLFRAWSILSGHPYHRDGP